MMRMNRKNRIIGQFMILLLAMGAAGWWIYEIRKDIPPVFHVVLPETVVDDVVETPPAELKDRLRSALQVVDRLPEKGVRLAEVDATLMLTPEEAWPGTLAEGEQRPEYVPPSLSLLFFNHQRFAVLDGRPYQEGDALKDGRVIRAIDSQGVTLEWPVTAEQIENIAPRMERIPWVPPLRVELKRPAPGVTGVSASASASASVSASASEKH